MPTKLVNSAEKKHKSRARDSHLCRSTSTDRHGRWNCSSQSPVCRCHRLWCRCAHTWRSAHCNADRRSTRSESCRLCRRCCTWPEPHPRPEYSGRWRRQTRTATRAERHTEPSTSVTRHADTSGNRRQRTRKERSPNTRARPKRQNHTQTEENNPADYFMLMTMMDFVTSKFIARCSLRSCPGLLLLSSSSDRDAFRGHRESRQQCV